MCRYIAIPHLPQSSSYDIIPITQPYRIPTSDPQHHPHSIITAQHLKSNISIQASHPLSPPTKSTIMSAPEIPSLHSKAEYLKAVMYEGVTILEGTATWCRQCKVIAPEVAKMVGEYPNVCIAYFCLYRIMTESSIESDRFLVYLHGVRDTMGGWLRVGETVILLTFRC